MLLVWFLLAINILTFSVLLGVSVYVYKGLISITRESE
jgi:hypothetical protein